MPQFDIAIYPAMIFWLFVVFGVLYAFVHWVFLDRIRGNIVYRQSTLDAWLLEAKELRAHAEKLAREDERKLTQAKEKALEHIASTLRDAQKKQEVEEADLLAKLDEKQKVMQAEMEKVWAGWHKELQERAEEVTDAMMAKMAEDSQAGVYNVKSVKK